MNDSNDKKKILYIRSGPYELSFDSYNLQEVGLGKAFCELGYDFDIIYYSKKNRDQTINTNQNNLTIFWRKGIKILRTGLYPSVLSKKFLSKYDIVFVSEYSQLMSIIIAHRHNNVFLYNGPYYNLFKIPIMEKIYDTLFCKYINSHIKKIFTKTRMSKDFLKEKGIKNSVVTGVGLDVSKFEQEIELQSNTQNLIDKMDGHRNLLYVGSISKRKNVEFLIQIFNVLKKDTEYKDLQLVLVGKGSEAYTQYCKSQIDREHLNDVIWYEFIKNSQMKFIYNKASIFLLPSVQEIFGMVLLEAMYFNVPTIASRIAGSDTLIRNKENGFIVDSFDCNQWVEKCKCLLENSEFSTGVGNNAGQTIRKDYMWSSIAKKMMDYFECN